MSLTQLIKSHASQIGFDLVGITKASYPTAHIEFFKKWMDAKQYATMNWMAKNQEKRQDLNKVLEGVKSVISLGLVYYCGKEFSIHRDDPDRGWISNYAWGDDYHDLIGDKLKQLSSFILSQKPDARLKTYVDTGPVLERSLAMQAGLGWIGKNTCLINTQKGSLFFLGEILTDIELETDEPGVDHCGKCTRCLDACPTDALKPYELDAHRCISYLTIEHRGEIDPKLQTKMGSHLVGCDICQDVCPWNAKIEASSQQCFEPRAGLENPALDDLAKLDLDGFRQKFKGSAIKRLKHEGLKRNLKIVQENLDRDK